MYAVTPSPLRCIRDRLTADHARLDDLLAQLLVAFEADDREQIQALWTAFEAGLVTHLEAEERFLIPDLLRRRERDARTILAEHTHIRTRLCELGAGIDLHIVRLSAARAFAFELRAHACHEEGIYAWADENLGEPARASLSGALGAGRGGRAS
jgi:hypothetical protein